MASKKLLVQLILNTLMYTVTVGINALAGASTLLNGRTTGQVSDLYPTPITPEGFTFSIWGLIYILLGAFVVYQTLPRNRDKPFQEKISYLFILSCILNISWIFLWQYGFFAYSVILIFALLASLIAIYLRLNIGKSAVSPEERICVRLPFSVYTAWITVASLADVAVAVKAAGWSGFGIDSSIWAALVIGLVLIVTLVVIATRRDVAYSLVIVWALFGIMAKQSKIQKVFWATTATIIITLIALAVMTIAIRTRKQR